jgi:hypothetical protein
MTDDEIGVGLADAIANVRQELERATAEGHGSEIGFEPGPLELEFEVGFETTKAGGAGVRVYVLTLGARAEAGKSGSHRLKLTFTPTRRAAAPASVADKLIGDLGKQ